MKTSRIHCRILKLFDLVISVRWTGFLIEFSARNKGMWKEYCLISECTVQSSVGSKLDYIKMSGSKFLLLMFKLISKSDNLCVLLLLII